MPRDAIDVDQEIEVGESERIHYCANCRAEISRGRWEIAMDGAHERVFFNPAGQVFRILCFREAPGAQDASPPSRDFTWFRGYSWRIATCRSCGLHLGWRYEGNGAPAVFFGLIKNALTGEK